MPVDIPERAGQAALLLAAQKAMQQKDWPRAVQCWDACIGASQTSSIRPHWSYGRAIALANCDRLAEAQEAFEALTVAHPEAPLGALGLARTHSARGEWHCALRHWDDCIDRFGSHPERLSWLRSRASVLERSNKWSAALEAWKTLASELPDLQVLSGCARCIIQLNGPTIEADESIERILTQFPGEQSALKLYARNALLRRDFETAMQRWEAYVAQFPDDLGGFEGVVATARQGGDVRWSTEFVAKAPDTMAQTLGFKCRVVMPLRAFQHDVVGGTALFRDVKDSKLDVANAVGIAQFLTNTMQFSEAVQFLTPLMEQFPARRSLVKLYLIAVLHSRGPSIFQVEKARLTADFDEADLLGIMRSLPSNHLSGAELRRLIDHILDTEPDGPRRTGELVTILDSNSVETAEHLRERLSASNSAEDRMFGRLLLARLTDAQRLSRANLGSVAWSEFKADADSLWGDIRREIATLPADDSMPLKRNMDLLFAATASRSRRWLNSGECYFDAASFADWFCKRIRSGQATSAIRLGDGEGNFLPYPPDERAVQREDQVDIQRRTWWGRELLSEELCQRFSRDFIEAIQKADALGLPPPARLLRNAESNQRSSRGIRAVLALVGDGHSGPNDEVTLTSCHIHQDLDNWDLYRQIFRCVETVSTVSCHDLSATLAEQFGVGVRVWHRMPPEKKFEGMFQYSEGDCSPLEAFQSIMAEIDPFPGELVLVAAGFLGKLICERVRERGGIALDIGSAADYWMGFQTRAYGRNQTIFDPSGSLIDGQPFENLFGSRPISCEKPCHTDLGRSTNLTGRFSPAVLRLQERLSHTRSLRIVGHPRCGSGYISQVFQRLGVQIGHERLGEHGICSWMHAVEDVSMPYAAPSASPEAFRLTLAYVRDPVDAIPSIMLENTRSKSFDFRRFHIYRLLGLDIAKSRDPFQRAVQSYLAWMRIVELQSPVATLRVEHIMDDFEECISQLSEAGLKISMNTPAVATKVPSDVNRSSDKFALPKPTIDIARYEMLPANLRRELIMFCNNHNYSTNFLRADPERTESC